jgi:hypothetical protein
VDKVKGNGGEVLTDLVNLVRHALIPTFTLVPYRDELRERYQKWLSGLTRIGERNSRESFKPQVMKSIGTRSCDEAR